MKAVPIIPWIGGKRRLADRLLPLFPPHECYVEVFFGGGALYFMRPAPAKTEVVNDINGDLVNLYRVVKNHPDELVRQFDWVLSSRDAFTWEQDKDVAGLTDVQRAARFYYLQQHAFGGKVAGQTFGTATTGRAPNLAQLDGVLRAAWRRLSGTYVERLSWEECVTKYDRPHTFFYMDPPYWQTEGYGVPFPFEQYLRMADLMRTMKGRAMVSINDHPDIRRAFAGHHILDGVDIKYAVANAQGAAPATSQELVICNWNPKEGGLF